jgi:hypothetical protein
MSEAKILLPKEGPVKTNEGPKKSRNEKKRYLLNKIPPTMLEHVASLFPSPTQIAKVRTPRYVNYVNDNLSLQWPGRSFRVLSHSER